MYTSADNIYLNGYDKNVLQISCKNDNLFDIVHADAPLLIKVNKDRISAKESKADLDI